MKRTILLIVALLLLFATEILRVYFIMPFPGSQKANTIELAYFIHSYIWWFRVAGLLLLIPLLVYALRHARWWKKIVLMIFVLLYGLVFYLFNFKFLADKMFYQPKNKIMAAVADNKVDSSQLVIGISINGQAKAYPIEIIGYHHQVQDTVGGDPVMVTYCTVCRTGRIFSPMVNGKHEQFRLVGMDHFNAMFEDATTGSWWRQATGVAVAGRMKGTALKELPSQQMRLGAWIALHPNTLIMQPDAFFADQYKGLKGFDDGTIKSGLEKRDSASWHFKSWVLGVQYGAHAKAYDWNELTKQTVINDTIAEKAVVLFLENDGKSFYVFSTANFTSPLHFVKDSIGNYMQETHSGSQWKPDGTCISGPYKDQRLQPLPAYQEFWHSWQQFHPGTTRYPR